MSRVIRIYTFCRLVLKTIIILFFVVDFSQQAHVVEITSFWRRCNVNGTCQNDVLLTSVHRRLLLTSVRRSFTDVGATYLRRIDVRRRHNDIMYPMGSQTFRCTHLPTFLFFAGYPCITSLCFSDDFRTGRAAAPSDPWSGSCFTCHITRTPGIELGSWGYIRCIGFRPEDEWMDDF